MPTESEELKLVITLDDQASGQLANLRTQLQSMSEHVNRAGGTIGGKSTEAAKAVKGLHGELSGLAARAGFIGGVIGVPSYALFFAFNQLAQLEALSGFGDDAQFWHERRRHRAFNNHRRADNRGADNADAD
jgi:hypothetical protein